MLVRKEKEKFVQDFSQKLKGVPLLIFTDFVGLKVKELEQLRKLLRENNCRLKVIRNRLFKLIEKEINFDLPQDFLIKETALIYPLSADVDPVKVAKTLSVFSKNCERFKIKGGFLFQRLLNGDEIIQIANLGSREILLAQLCGTLTAPIKNFILVCKGIISNFLNTLEALKKKEEEGKK